VHLAADYIHPTPRGGRCRVRIFLPEEPDRDAPVVVCTELPNNPGQSVTNSAEQIAAEVIRAHRLPTPLVWIEHYPPESTDWETETFGLDLLQLRDLREDALPGGVPLHHRGAHLEAPGPPECRDPDRRAAAVK
jgi:hypothetical protein